MKFLQISDTHFLEDYGQNHDLFEDAFLHMTCPLKKLNKISQEVGEIDFILHCGDLCHSGTEADYQKIKAVIAQFFPSVPFMVTCGNRDDKALLQKVFYQQDGEEFCYSKDFGDLRVVTFNNANGTPQGEMTQEMCEVLWDEMKKDLEKPTILFCHHHYIPDQIESMQSVAYPDLFLDILEKGNVIALMTGHTHHQYQGDFASVPCFTVPPLSFVAQADPQGQEVFEAGGYHVFSYEEGRLRLDKLGDLGYHHKIGRTK